MLLTVSEAAKLRGTTRFSIHRWIKSGLRARRLGEQWFIEQRHLDKFKPRPVGSPKKRKNRARDTLGCPGPAF